MKTHDCYMNSALMLAMAAFEDGETPVGCVITDKTGKIIGRGRNRREKIKNALSHAELEAIRKACKTLDDWRLDGCSIYVTLEPCPMCAGAIIMSRIDKLYYGAKDSQTGACGSVINLFMESFGHKTQVYGGILAQECAAPLTDFFKKIRQV